MAVDNSNLMEKKQRVLIVTSKWFRHNSATRTSSIPYPHISFLIDSLNSSGIGEAIPFCYDEYSQSNSDKPFVVALVDTIIETNPDMIVFESVNLGLISTILTGSVSSRFLSASPTDMKYYQNFFAYLNDRFKKPVVIYWPDVVGMGDYSVTAKQLEEFVAFHNIWDFSLSPADFPKSKYLFTFAPSDHSLFNNDNDRERDVDISFVGKTETLLHRVDILTTIKNLGIKSEIYAGGLHGGQKTYISMTQVADLYKHSKLVVNFSLTPSNQHQVKGRVFEATLCGALLLEQENEETAKYFEPYKDYVPWTDKNDLISKIKYYLKNTAEMELIRKSGAKKANDHYSGRSYWERIFQKANEIEEVVFSNKSYFWPEKFFESEQAQVTLAESGIHEFNVLEIWHPKNGQIFCGIHQSEGEFIYKKMLDGRYQKKIFLGKTAEGVIKQINRWIFIESLRMQLLKLLKSLLRN